MRRIWTSRGVLLLALAASFVLIGGDVQNAAASPFKPTLTTSLSNSAAGATSDINQAASWGTSPFDGNRAFPSSAGYFTPGDWDIPNCAGLSLATQAACPYGLDLRTGNFSSVTALTILNQQCAGQLAVNFPNGMRNSSTDPSDSISPGTHFANLVADTNPADGIPDGVEHWNTLLGGLQSAGLLPATPPRERQTLSTVIPETGTVVWLDVVTFDPGLLGGAASAPLGYGSTFILENANPLNPPAPDIVTDVCGTSTSITQSGRDADNETGNECANNVDDDGDGFVNDGCRAVGPAESGAACSNDLDDDGDGVVNDGCPAQGIGAPHRTNPSSPGTKLFTLNTGSQRDADQGPSAPVEPTVYSDPFDPNFGFNLPSGHGFVNSLDTCPYQPNIGSPEVPSGQPFNGDDSEGGAGDGIDEICDAQPSTANLADVDHDSYLNRLDNCPQVTNGLDSSGNVVGPNNQADLSEVAGPPAANEVGQQPVDGGPASDSIGDACDLNPTVPDGHFHSVLKGAPVCVGLTDSDGDGWCNLSEGGLGSDPNNSMSTPEALAVPVSCSDGVDNDGDGNADLNDSAGGPAAPSGCQLNPQHDLIMKNLTGPTATPCNANTKTYRLTLNHNQSGNQSGEISIYLDSQPSYVPPAGPSPAAGKSAGSVVAGSVSGATVTQSGPINIDGDADVEWLTKATVTIAPGTISTVVSFRVAYPPVSPCTGLGTTDFMITADLCHGNDIAPLGVGPLNGACAGAASSDGGQDRNSANDIKSLPIDAN